MKMRKVVLSLVVISAFIVGLLFTTNQTENADFMPPMPSAGASTL